MKKVKEEGVPINLSKLPLQGASWDIWKTKYCLHDKSGNPIEKIPLHTFRRVAKELASVEGKPSFWEERFMNAMVRGALPAGRILANAGAGDYKPATSTINCTVSGVVTDSMHGILEKVYEAGMTLKAGCGIGYEFSTLRPRGAYVSGAGAYTSGPLSFMDIYDKMCFTISSAGGRRGAQMATFDIGHPDVLDFIKAKREDGRLRQFNLSLLVHDDFMEAVKDDDVWPLAFPLTQEEVGNCKIDIHDKDQVVWRKWPITSDYVTDDSGSLVACKIYKTMPARDIWDEVMKSTYDYAEPGVIFIDRINYDNNNWWCENIRATNPCGEEPLPSYGSCLLGSVNLTKFVRSPFTADASFDWEEYVDVVRVFTRMLDNVVEINGLPLAQQQKEILDKRRHGMGFLGLGSALTMLGIRYGSKKSVKFTEKVSRVMAIAGWHVGLELAREKGPAPIMLKSFPVTDEMLTQCPKMREDGWVVGNHILGRVLFGGYSNYMQKLRDCGESHLVDQIQACGARFTHHTSIAPTGTISLSLGNNVSNGIEPSFAHEYYRNVIHEGKKTKEQVRVLSYEYYAYQEFMESEVAEIDELPDYFVTSENVSPKEHVAIQAAAQKYVDSSISKTINIPSDFSFPLFKNVYTQAYVAGLKGCTTFRFNPEALQGVLVKDKDLGNTTYQFELDDGSVIEVKGNDEVEYDGELHSAANLFDALKEGYYGRF